MFTKQRIIVRLRETGFDAGEYWVVAGAAMVLHGVKESTGDIDLGCDSRMADRLQEAGCETRVLADGTRRIRYDSDIELFENWRAGAIEAVDSVPVVSLKGVIEMKRQLGREKDLRDIEQIQKYLMQRTVCVDSSSEL